MKPNLNILRYLLAFFPLAALALCVGMLVFKLGGHIEFSEIFSSSERSFFKAEFEEMNAMDDELDGIYGRVPFTPAPELDIQMSAQDKKYRKTLMSALHRTFSGSYACLFLGHRLFAFWTYMAFDKHGGPHPVFLEEYSNYIRNTTLPMAQRLSENVPVLLEYYGETSQPFVQEYQEHIQKYVERAHKTLAYLDAMRPFPEKPQAKHMPEYFDLQALYATLPPSKRMREILAEDPNETLEKDLPEFPYIDPQAVQQRTLPGFTPAYVEGFRRFTEENTLQMNKAIDEALATEKNPVLRERYTLLAHLYKVLPDRIEWMLADHLAFFKILSAYKINGPEDPLFYYYPIDRIVTFPAVGNSMPLYPPFTARHGDMIFTGKVLGLLEAMGSRIFDYMDIRYSLHHETYGMRKQCKIGAVPSWY